jgi:hypothetical protein
MALHPPTAARHAGGISCPLLCALLFALALPTIALAGASDGLFIGAGALSGRVSSAALADSSAAFGYEVAFGWRRWQRVSFELRGASLGKGHATVPIASPFYPADQAEAGVFALTVRADILELAQNRWTPWLGLGGGLATLQWHKFYYELDGLGLVFEAGVDFELTTGLILRTRLSTLGVSTADTNGDRGPSLRASSLSLSLVYEFGRPERPAPTAPPAG